MPAPPPARFRHADTWRLLTKGEAARLSLELLPLAAKGYKAADVGLARVASSWLEVPIADGWLAAYRLVPQDGQPVIAEVRVFPAEAGRRTAGTWSGEFLGPRATVPRGGLTSRILHSVPLGAHRRQQATILKEMDPVLRASIMPDISVTDRIAARSGLGRKPLPAARLARLAAAYVQAYRKGDRHPIVTVARSSRLSVPRVRDWINRARRRGLLSVATKQGRAGGWLTDKARAVLTLASRQRTRKKRGK